MVEYWKKMQLKLHSPNNINLLLLLFMMSSLMMMPVHMCVIKIENAPLTESRFAHM